MWLLWSPWQPWNPVHHPSCLMCQQDRRSHVAAHFSHYSLTPTENHTLDLADRCCLRARAHPWLGACVFPKRHQSHVLLIKDIMHSAEKARRQWSEFRLYNPPDLIIPTSQCSRRYAGKLSQRHSEGANFSFCFLVGCYYCYLLLVFREALCLSFFLRFPFCGWRSVYLESVRQFATFSSFKMFIFLKDWIICFYYMKTPLFYLCCNPSII